MSQSQNNEDFVKNNYPVKVYERDQIKKDYRKIVFKPGAPSQSPEMNELQQLTNYNFSKLSSSIYPDGYIISGGFQEVSDIRETTESVVTINSAFNTQFNVSDTFYNKVEDGYKVTFVTNSENGILPDPLNVYSEYYVAKITNNVISVAATQEDLTENNYVEITSAGVGAFSVIYSKVTAKQILFKNTLTSIEGNMYELPEDTLIIKGTEEELVGLLLKETYITSQDDPSLLNPALGTANYGSPGADRIKYEISWSLIPENVSDSIKFFPLYTFVYGVLKVTSNENEDEQSRILNLLAEYNYASNGSYLVNGMEIVYIEDDTVNGNHVFELVSGDAFVEGYHVQAQYNQRFYIPFLDDKRTIENEYKQFSGDRWYQTSWYPISEITEIDVIKQNSKSRSRGNSEGYSPESDLIDGVYSVVSIVEVWREDNNSPTGKHTYTQWNQDTNTGDYKLEQNQFILWLGADEPVIGSTYYVTYQYSTTAPIIINNKEFNNNDPLKPNYTPEIPTPDDKMPLNSMVYLSDLVPGSFFRIDYSFYLKRIDRVAIEKDGSITIIPGIPNDTNPIPVYNTSGLSLALILITRLVNPDITMDTNRVYRMSDIRKMNDRISVNEYNIAQLALKDDIRQGFPITNKLNMVVDSFMNDNGRDMGISQNCQVTGDSLIGDFTITEHEVRSGDPILLNYSEVKYLENLYSSKSRSVNIYSNIKPQDNINISVTPNVFKWVAKENVVTSSQYKVYGTHRWHSLQEVKISSSTAQATAVYTVPNINIKINAQKLNAGEPCKIYIDNTLLGTFNANANGILTNAVVTLRGIKSGTRLIRVVGTKSGGEAKTTFTAIPLVKTVKKVYWYESDPLAQTYMTTYDAFITSIDLYVTSLPRNYMEVLLTNTLVGFPNHEEAYNLKRKYRAELVNNARNNFRFTTPSRVSADQLESFIVACPDNSAQIRVSELGKYDDSKKEWITKQGYALGTLLESSDAKTWSPIHTEDIKFTIYRAKFNKTKTLDLGIVEVTDATDIILNTVYELYPSTSIEYTAYLIDRIVNGNPEKISIEEGVITEIKKYTGKIRISAKLTSDNNTMSPVINGNVTLSSLTRLWPSNYISRRFNVTELGQSYLRVLLDQSVPEGSSINLYYLDTLNYPNPDFSISPYDPSNFNNPNPDPNNPWIKMIEDGNRTYISRSIYQYSYKNTVNLRNTCIQIVMNTTNDLNRPVCQNLRIFVEPI